MFIFPFVLFIVVKIEKIYQRFCSKESLIEMMMKNTVVYSPDFAQRFFVPTLIYNRGRPHFVDLGAAFQWTRPK